MNIIDRNYKEAIIYIKQMNQSVNNLSSFAEIFLENKKLKQFKITLMLYLYSFSTTK
jgi:hypothetical protein